MRSEERLRVCYPGYLFIDGRPLTRCRIEDISPGGARLMVDDPAAIPDVVQLKFSPAAPNYRECQVRWRKANCVGVQFISKFDGIASSAFKEDSANSAPGE